MDQIHGELVRRQSITVQKKDTKIKILKNIIGGKCAWPLPRFWPTPHDSPSRVVRSVCISSAAVPSSGCFIRDSAKLYFNRGDSESHRAIPLVPHVRFSALLLDCPRAPFWTEQPRRASCPATAPTATVGWRSPPFNIYLPREVLLWQKKMRGKRTQMKIALLVWPFKKGQGAGWPRESLARFTIWMMLYRISYLRPEERRRMAATLSRCHRATAARCAGTAPATIRTHNHEIHVPIRQRAPVARVAALRPPALRPPHPLPPATHPHGVLPVRGRRSPSGKFSLRVAGFPASPLTCVVLVHHRNDCATCNTVQLRSQGCSSLCTGVVVCLKWSPVGSLPC